MRGYQRGRGSASQAMLASLVQGCSVLVVIGIWTFVYAVVGMSLYGAQDYQHSQGLLATHANFATFDSAMLLLVRCATGEAWSGIMHGTVPVCVDRSPPVVGDAEWADTPGRTGL